MQKVTIGIIGGKGIMGSFFGKFFRKQGFDVLISDLDTKLSNKALVSMCHVVVVAVPMDVTERVIKEIAPLLKPEQLLMDLTSLKTFPLRSMMKSKAAVIGLHPMFRPGPAGLKGQTMVMCPARCTAAQKSWVKKIFSAAGATVTEMTAHKHDELMAIIQVLIHFHCIVLGNTMRALRVNLRQTMKAMSPIYRLQFDVVSRTFAQNPKLYASIQMLNPHAPRVLKTFLKATEEMARIGMRKDTAAFQKAFKKTGGFLGAFAKQGLKESDELLQFFQRAL